MALFGLRTTGDGNAGTIVVNSGTLTLTAGAQIDSRTLGAGQGGGVTLRATDAVVIAGQDSEGFPSGIFSRTESSGVAGNIQLEAPEVSLAEGALIDGNTFGEGQGGQVTITATHLAMAGGDIRARTTGDGNAGTIVVNSGTLTLTAGAQIDSRTLGAGQGGGVTLRATDAVVIAGQDSEGFPSGIFSRTESSGVAGNIQLEAPEVSLAEGALIDGNTFGEGQGGQVTITATHLAMAGGDIQARTTGDGNAGTIVVNSGTLTLTAGAQIDSRTLGAGQGGGVTLRATDAVVIAGQDSEGFPSGIFSRTESSGVAGNIQLEAPEVSLAEGALIDGNTFGEGQGGQVTITATHLAMAGGDIQARTTGDGNAGTIVVNSGTLTLTAGAQIDSRTLGAGQGGGVTLRATDAVVIAGQDSEGFPSGIFSRTESSGVAGNIQLEAPEVSLAEGALIDGNTFGEGQGGQVTITATHLAMAGGDIRARTTGDGNAGTIVVNSGTLTLTAGAQIDSRTLGAGQGGGVTLRATDAVVIAGQDSEGFPSGIFSRTESSGVAGNIQLEAPEVSLAEGAAVSAESVGNGDAGNIRIAAQEVTLRGGSAVTTTAGQGEAGGGNIFIGGTITDDAVITDGVETLTLDGSQMTANTDTGSGANITIGVQHLVLDGASTLTANTRAGTGGNLRVTADGTMTTRADTVVLRGSMLTANARAGMGGRIDIVTEAFLADPDSVIDASSKEGGINGVVNVETVVSNLSEIVTPLPPDFASAASLLRDQCAARLREGQLSSLVISGREGMPAKPGGVLPSPMFSADRERMGALKQAEPLAETVTSHPTGDGAPSYDIRQGWISFQHGDFEQATRHWQQVVRALEREGEADQQSVALAYLAQAYQRLGHYQQALQNLQSAQTLAARSGDRVLEASILGELGNVSLPLGRLDQAAAYLHDGLRLARVMKADELVATVLNNRGNLFASQEAFDEALWAYRESARLAKLTDNPALTARALTNAALVTLRRGEPQEAQALVDKALPVLQALSPSHEKAYGLVSVGLVYANLRAHLPAVDASLLQLALRSFNDTIAVVQAIGDDRAASYAWGYLGKLYEDEGRYQEALALTRRAVFAVQSVQAPEASYLWQWQSGRVLQVLGQREAAIDAYRQAVETLQAMRDEMLVTYGEPLHFRETVAPVYAEFLDLLLQPGAAEEALEEARQLLESLKVAELQNYFQDECVAALRLRETSLDEVSQTAVVVYPVLLPDRTELLVSLPTGAGASKLQRFAVAIGVDRITEEVRAFRQKLEKRTTRQYLRHAQRLYDWLVRPLEPTLASLAVTTLVFVPDGALRTIPMAALHNGEQFLIQKYALAITPGLNLTDPRPLPQPARVLAAGFSQPVEGLSALPYVETELRAIANLYKSDFLLNQDFKVSRLEKTLKRGVFPIVHIASHGQFSGNLDDTFILAFNDKLTMERLDQLLGPLRFRDEPIELLTLSACQTAAGDDQAALGLAGVAVKAGARSALATLWYINDQASSELVAEFYRQLRAPSVSRATALQRAQIHLLDNPNYQHPSYWAPFLLINNWL